MSVYDKLLSNGISLSEKDIDYIASRYNIRELAIFGSAIRDDFNENSDIDFLVEFNDSEKISLFDLLDIQEYLEKLTNRPVGIVEPAGLKNPYRREAILESKETLYVAE